MGCLVIRVFVTTSDGQREFGKIAFDGKQITTVGDTDIILDDLLWGIDRSDAAAVMAALRRAPEVFDGAYVRASITEE